MSPSNPPPGKGWTGRVERMLQENKEEERSRPIVGEKPRSTMGDDAYAATSPPRARSSTWRWVRWLLPFGH